MELSEHSLKIWVVFAPVAIWFYAWFILVFRLYLQLYTLEHRIERKMNFMSFFKFTPARRELNSTH